MSNASMDLGTGFEELRALDPAAYASAEPFPHAVFHDVFSDELLDGVLSEFPAPERMGIQFDEPEEVKSAESRWDAFGPSTQRLLTILNSAPFVDQLERITGISGLITDHHFRGGGQHQIRRGGYLGVHADFNHHLKLKVIRRINVLVYLNHDWDDAWGGQLELWDTAMTHPMVKVTPAFNTMVMFSTNSDSFHGHPDPLTCPPERARRSIATYYYTAAPGALDDIDPHSTLFRDRPGVAPRTSKYAKAKHKYALGAEQFREATRLLVPDRVVEIVKRKGS